MAKKQQCPEFENHERWLVAFADMMTLLFALFVVLYSIANVDKAKVKKVAISIQKAMGTIPSDGTGSGAVGKGNSRTEGIHRKMKGNTSRNSLLTRNRREMAAIIASDKLQIERAIEQRLYGSESTPSAQRKPEDRIVNVAREADGIRVSLLARKFFKPNEIGLDPEAKAALSDVADAVKGMGRIIRVEGHTDNLAFRKNGLTNWELSAIRAAAVVRYLIDEKGFASTSVYAAGFADSYPVAANDTPENRMLNRRVDLKILYDTPPEAMTSTDDGMDNLTEGDEEGGDEPAAAPAKPAGK